MLCDICQKRKARIYYTEIMNGEKKEQHLCEECAAAHTTLKIKNPITNQEVAIGNLLSGILNTYYAGGNTGAADAVKETVCGYCGMTGEEFMQKGKFGCASCYDSFERIVQRNMKTIQGADLHTGKRPKRLSLTRNLDFPEEKKNISAVKQVKQTKPRKKPQTQKPLSELDRLTMKLQQAIEVEEYEEAARLRDEIKALKAGKTKQ